MFRNRYRGTISAKRLFNHTRVSPSASPFAHGEVPAVERLNTVGTCPVARGPANSAVWPQCQSVHVGAACVRCSGSCSRVSRSQHDHVA